MHHLSLHIPACTAEREYSSEIIVTCREKGHSPCLFFFFKWKTKLRRSLSPYTCNPCCLLLAAKGYCNSSWLKGTGMQGDSSWTAFSWAAITVWVLLKSSRRNKRKTSSGCMRRVGDSKRNPVSPCNTSSIVIGTEKKGKQSRLIIWQSSEVIACKLSNGVQF